MSILIKQARVVTMNSRREVFTGDLWIEKDRITKIGKRLSGKAKRTIDAKGFTLLPGLIQTHIHLCQTLFRNQAENLELLDWLQQKIWPLEGGHTPKSLRLSADLGGEELLKNGTTTILDMGTVHHTDEIFKSCEKSGLRAFIGKAHMDRGKGVAASLR